MGFQKRTTPERFKNVRFALITYSGVDQVGCSCGWTTRSGRIKVREDRIDRHLAKRHNGRGMRMPS